VPITLPIREIVAATPRASVVRLDLDGNPFNYVAGQAVLVGARGAERKRPYSIANAPEEAVQSGCLELLVGIDGQGRAGPHLPLTLRTPIEVEGPLGSFTFPAAPDERRFLFVAGGTGIAPLRAMLQHAIAATDGAAHVGLVYSARTPDDFAFGEEFRRLASGGTIEFRQTITRDGGTDWSGPRGRISRDTLGDLIHDTNTLCFVCGPMAMVDEVPRLLQDIGVSRERIRIEEW
jgi:NAD(P)H-flavin reductase